MTDRRIDIEVKQLSGEIGIIYESLAKDLKMKHWPNTLPSYKDMMRCQELAKEAVKPYIERIVSLERQRTVPKPLFIQE